MKLPFEEKLLPNETEMVQPTAQTKIKEYPPDQAVRQAIEGDKKRKKESKTLKEIHFFYKRVVSKFFCFNLCVCVHRGQREHTCRKNNKRRRRRIWQ